MSLLKKASIITTPTAYAEDYLYSIKPALSLGAEEITNGNFSVSGTINATSYSLGFASSDTGGTFTISNQQVTLARINGSTRLRGTNGVDSLNFLTSGKKYRLVYNVISNNGASAFYYYNGSTGVAAPSTVGQHTIDYTSVGTQFYLETQNNGSNITLDGISIKEITDADFDFDRNSTGTRVNEDYLIEDVPYNFVTNSEEFNSSNYTKSGVSVVSNDIMAPNGTLTADKLVEDTSNGAHQIYDAVLTSSGNITNSIMVKAAGRTKIRVNSGSNSHRVDFDLSTATKSNEVGATGSIVSVSDGWYRCIVSWNNTTLAAQYLFIALLDNSGNTSYTGDGSSGVYIWGGQLVKGDQPKEYLKTTDRLDIPRIDYTNGEPSILLEPSRTNLETKSNEFSTWGVISNTTRTANYTQSPEGLNNATRLQFTANGYVANTPQILGTYTISCYAKRNDSGTQNVGFFTNGSGVVNSAWAVTSEWKRFSYTFPTLNGSYMGIAGVSGADISVYGFQIEGLVSYATSYIPTSGSTVTRSADSLPNPLGAVGTPTGNKAVIYLEVASTETTNRNFVGFVNGTTNQYGLYHWGATDNYKFGFNTWNTDSYGIINANNLLNGEFNKIAALFDFTDFTNNKLYINGRQQTISQVKGTTLQRSAAGLGITAPSSNQVPIGNFKSVMMFDQELTDEELEKLTGYNNHELYLNYYNRLSYLGLVEEYNVESDINNYIL